MQNTTTMQYNNDWQGRTPAQLKTSYKTAVWSLRLLMLAILLAMLL